MPPSVVASGISLYADGLITLESARGCRLVNDYSFTRAVARKRGS